MQQDNSNDCKVKSYDKLILLDKNSNRSKSLMHWTIALARQSIFITKITLFKNVIIRIKKVSNEFSKIIHVYSEILLRYYDV